MKKVLLLSLSMLFVLCALVWTGSAAAALELKLGHSAALDHPGNKAAVMFAEAVEKRTNGEIHVTIFPNNELGSPPERLEQLKLGVLDMNLGTQGQLQAYSMKFGVVMLPFVFNSYEHAYKVLDGPFMEWTKTDAEKNGIILLSNWEYGFRNVTNNVRPINSPDDLKGLKMRVPPEIQMQAFVEGCGAVITTIAFPELYMALKQGVVDGQENPLSVIYYNKYYEVQKYLAITNHIYNSYVHMISKKTWEKLTPEQQKIILEESAKAGNYMRKAIQSEEADLVEKLKAEGMIVTYPEISVFREKMKPVYNKLGKVLGEENVETFLNMVESIK